ncbi:unnamed protein product [Nesidiocoris tenuis]|uniref:Uncharacterized protein n=1 Tax=Nesidiocoris tenuis TaxID=355587 RepID=A0A6H5GNB8_9HEMI|nr:unnamed protein product [Nesidiocoris tenuis]
MKMMVRMRKMMKMMGMMKRKMRILKNDGEDEEDDEEVDEDDDYDEDDEEGDENAIGYEKDEDDDGDKDGDEDVEGHDEDDDDEEGDADDGDDEELSLCNTNQSYACFSPGTLYAFSIAISAKMVATYRGKNVETKFSISSTKVRKILLDDPTNVFLSLNYLLETSAEESSSSNEVVGRRLEKEANGARADPDVGRRFGRLRRRGDEGGKRRKERRRDYCVTQFARVRKSLYQSDTSSSINSETDETEPNMEHYNDSIETYERPHEREIIMTLGVSRPVEHYRL